MTQCYHVGCGRNASLKRQLNRDGSTYRFCSEHDPLEDPALEEIWQEA